MGDNDNLNIFAESPRGPPWQAGGLEAMDGSFIGLSAREFGELASELQLEGLDMAFGGRGPPMPTLGHDMAAPAPPAPMAAAPTPPAPDAAAPMDFMGVTPHAAGPSLGAGQAGQAAAAPGGAVPAAPPQSAAAAQQQREAAAQISRLYNHMLLQLPVDVQRRAQQHLILRTAAMRATGVPVLQGTMLVQQELLPLMQQAFMHLATGGSAPAFGGGGAAAAVAAPAQQQAQQQAADAAATAGRQHAHAALQQQQQAARAAQAVQAEAQRAALLRQQAQQQAQLDQLQRLQALHMRHQQVHQTQQAEGMGLAPPAAGAVAAAMSLDHHMAADAQQAQHAKRARTSSGPSRFHPLSVGGGGAAPASGCGPPTPHGPPLPADPIAAAAVARGRAAAAKIQSGEAAARYAWNAGVLAELFDPTPVHQAGLLGREAVVGGDGTSLMPPPLPVAMGGPAPEAGGQGGAAASASLLGGLARLSPAQLAAAGTDGQRLLVAAMRRLQAMQDAATATAGEASTASPSASAGTATPEAAAAPSGAAQDGEGGRPPRDSRIATGIRIVPSSLRLTRVDIPAVAAAGAAPGAPPPPADDGLPAVQL